MIMGMAQTVPAVFLTLFCDHKQLQGIGTFFWFYAPTAIVMRLAGRRWPDQLGRRKSALVGLACVMTSMLLYLLVETEWDLAWSALAAGTGQALLFPAVTTLGAESFPERYRATGTTLILSFIDVGGLCAAPALGLLIDHFGFGTMFTTAAAASAGVAIAFGTASWLRRVPASGTGDTELVGSDQPLPSISE
jgi:MFS family permease